MRILLLNTVCASGSVGKICANQARGYARQGHTVKIAYGREGFVPEDIRPFAHRIGTDRDGKLHGLRTRLTDTHGFGSARATRKFLAWAEHYDPQLLWLHNLHGYYIHIGLLMDWIKSRPQMEVRWTLHDCWAFTGHCAYFDYAGCDGWKTGCRRCVQKGEYPASRLLSNSAGNYRRKKELFTGLPKLTLVTPSKWLAELVKESFLGCYPVEVVPNTIDMELFRPTAGDFRLRHGLENRILVLGVANNWERRKGLEDFIKLAELLDDRYRIVLVGLRPEQIRKLPQGILGITRTESPQALAQLYTTADVFVNPTYEDNYPTVNLEAAACGTPVITYRTGGSVESVPPEQVVEKGDVPGLKAMIEKLTGEGK